MHATLTVLADKRNGDRDALKVMVVVSTERQVVAQVVAAS